MKVNANPIHALPEGARALHGARASAKTSSTAPEPAPAPAESTVTLSAKKIPPGLQRVAARLESLGAEGRSPGQTNALSQINRNLQRYVDTMALAPSPALTPTPTPAPDPAGPAPSDGVAVPGETETGDAVEAASAATPPAVQAGAPLA